MKLVLSMILSVIFVFFCQAQRRDKDIKMVAHTVKPNETVLKISKQYQVDPSEVYRNNRDALDGISSGMVLQIPVPKGKMSKQEDVSEVVVEKTEVKNTNEEIKVVEKQVIAAEKNTEVTAKTEEKPTEVKTVITKRIETLYHKVQQGETLYGLSKRYNLSVGAIQEANASLLREGLKIGQVITIPSENNGSIQQVRNQTAVKETIINHKVEPKETLYGLSKRYNVSVEDILNQNKEVREKGLQVGQIITIKTN